MDANEAAARAWALRVNLMRVALSILRQSADAEDAVSTAMLTACQRAAQLSDPDKYTAWLMRILVRGCYDILRKRRRESPEGDPAAFDRPILMTPETTVWDAILTLPEPYRSILILHYYEGFKAREIAGILGMPLGTVLVRLSRGRTQLKESLIAEGVVHGDEQTV